MRYKGLYILFFVFVCVLPFQTHYFFVRPMIQGVFFEYASMSFYLFDLFFFIIFFLTVFIHKKIFLQKLSKQWPFLLCLALFEIAILLSIIMAQDKILAWYGYARMVQGMLLALCLCIVSFSYRQVACAWMAAGIIPSLLGVWQFWTNKVIGSSVLGIATQEVTQKGVSVIEMQGERFLRAYGTFPHPNVFGGFLVMTLLSTMYVFFNTRQQRMSSWILGIFCLEILALFFTFSRSAWMAFLFGSIFFLVTEILKKNSYWKHMLFCFLVMISFFIALYVPFIQTRLIGQERIEQQSMTQRLSQYQQAISVFYVSPILGVGIFQYTPTLLTYDAGKLIWDYQPVHNVFLLLLSELGIVGLIAFLYLSLFTAWKLRGKNTYVVAIYICTLCLCLLDHYFWTLPTGILIFWSIFGLTHSLPKDT